MEADKPLKDYTPNILPVVAVAERAGKWIIAKLSIYPNGAQNELSTHYKGSPSDGGAEAMLYEQLRLQDAEQTN